MRSRRVWGAVAAVWFCVGCGTDLYAPCSLDPNARDESVRQCAESDSRDKLSCAIQGQIQCDTRVCGRYQGSEPFCTSRCASDADCVGGFCREFVFQSGQMFCVEETDAS